MQGVGRTGRDVAWSLWSRHTSSTQGALVFVDAARELRTVPYANLAEMSESAASRLHGLGVRKGDRLLLAATNSVELIVAIGAAARLGAIAAPTNVALTAPEIAYQLADLAPKAVLVQGAHQAKVEEALHIAAVDVHRLSLGGPSEWESLIVEGAPPEAPPAVALDPMDPFLIFYTSGSTDRPKGVVHSQRAAVEEATRMADAWAVRPDDVFYSSMPVFHVSGMYCTLLPAMLRGATVVTLERFSASRWASEVRATGATITPLVSAQVRMLMATESEDPTADRDNKIRLAPCGMAPPKDMEDAFVERFGTGPLYALSGSTETVAVTYVEPAFSEHRWPTIGRPAADREVILLDDEGKPVPIGAEGEMCIRGARGGSLMLEYWNNPEATRAAVVDGWYHTSDIGRMDEDGFLYFVDRKKDIIKRSGDNVAASEVERVIAQFPGINDAAVVGKPDPVRDWAIVAFLELLPDVDDVDLGKLEAHCREQLAAYKVPEEFHVLPELPRGSVGKIEKKALRKMLEDPS